MAATIESPNEPTDRRSRRRVRTRAAILSAAVEIMSEKGIDEATMAEISERADVALGSLYNHFASKDALAVAVVDDEIVELARSIEERTSDFDDPAMVFAFGCRTVMAHATANARWRQLLESPGVIAERFRIGFGPYATKDIRNAVDAGRFVVAEVDLAWRLCTWVIIGTSAAVCSEELDAAKMSEALVAILGIVGVDPEEAERLIAALPA